MTQAPGGWEVLAVVVPVPPFTCLLRDLAPATNYSLRVRCANALGPSPYADWVPFRTKGLGKGRPEQSGWSGLEWEKVLVSSSSGWSWLGEELPESELYAPVGKH